ncbi:PAS domain-containing protein [Rhodanobacter sp. MP1X3]|uniref:helix-turn-helix transcriptional regulator n=1 Tax=Rhodanobacter sp. MP1X3 TaxID=2723086 RepID=UPI00161DBE51|nr:PAS domain-containing protein [Rhodanobacter sp. MP1X3]MBB6241883.1 putative transcriptional regulator YheO [Rhodanobacter sp. MP1X3]
MPKRTKIAQAKFASYFPVADAIATLFRPHVEVVIHDLSSLKVAYIANSISRRRIGDSSVADQVSEESLAQAVIGPYRKVNKDGRNLRSVTAVIRDADQQPAAMMCINFDVSTLERIRDEVSALAFLPESLEPHAPFFHDNWRQALERLVQEVEREEGIPVKSFNTSLRFALIEKISDSGFLSMRNAPPVVAERVGISRAALYKYLKEIRSRA